jgi:hypothetical protein
MTHHHQKQIKNPKIMAFARPSYHFGYYPSKKISIAPLKVNMTRKMNIINKAILGLCLLLFMGIAGQSYAQSSEGTLYDLDYISVEVPRDFEIEYEEGEKGKEFMIYDDSSDSFGMIYYDMSATNPFTQSRGIDYLKQQLYSYEEIKRGCNDGLIALNVNYCSVAYYAEYSSSDDGQYYFQTSTQIGEDFSVVWSLHANDIDSLTDKTAVLLNIINSMYIH